MNTASILFGSVGLSTDRIIKTTVNLECLFGLVGEAVERAEDAYYSESCWIYSNPVKEFLCGARKNSAYHFPQVQGCPKSQETVTYYHSGPTANHLLDTHFWCITSLVQSLYHQEGDVKHSSFSVMMAFVKTTRKQGAMAC